VRLRARAVALDRPLGLSLSCARNLRLDFDPSARRGLWFADNAVVMLNAASYIISAHYRTVPFLFLKDIKVAPSDN
jgi:hypothetical protein